AARTAAVLACGIPIDLSSSGFSTDIKIFYVCTIGGAAMQTFIFYPKSPHLLHIIMYHISNVIELNYSYSGV
uniref:hypothetical protein n=1 Tax=Salmonella sp. s33260 TaxID=3159640 RepID=UPI0039816561